MFPCTGTANYVRIDLWGCAWFRTFDILISETALPPTAVTSLLNHSTLTHPSKKRTEQYHTLVTLESRSEVKATLLGCSVYWTDIVKTMTGPVPYLNDLCFGITSCKINNIGEIALSCDAFMLCRRHIIALWGWFCRDVLPVTCCEHGPPIIATVHFSKFSIATNILFN